MTPTPGGRDDEIIDAVDDDVHSAIVLATFLDYGAEVMAITEPVNVALDDDGLSDAIQGAIEEWTP